MKKTLAVFILCVVAVAFADNPHVTQLIELFDVAISSPADGDVLTYSAPTAKWTNKPPAAVPEGPKIVARFDQVGTGNGNQHLALFTPGETAMYRITDTASAADTSGGVNYTDSLGSPLATIVSGNIYPVAGGFQKQHIVIASLNAGNTVFIDSTISASMFSLHIVVEKL